MAQKIAAAERMLNLLALLAQRTRPITLKQIRAELTRQYSDNNEAARAQFERDKAELRITAGNELIGLRDAFTLHDARLYRSQYTQFLHGLNRCATVGRNSGICDR